MVWARLVPEETNRVSNVERSNRDKCIFEQQYNTIQHNKTTVPHSRIDQCVFEEQNITDQPYDILEENNTC